MGIHFGHIAFRNLLWRAEVLGQLLVGALGVFLRVVLYSRLNLLQDLFFMTASAPLVRCAPAPNSAGILYSPWESAPFTIMKTPLVVSSYSSSSSFSRCSPAGSRW